MAGLVLQGGAMRAGFVAGALMALMDRGLTNFKSAFAVSASVPTLAYFAADQREEIENIWRRELKTPKLVRYRNIPSASLTLSAKRPILDIDYLVYEVFKEKYPINIPKLLSSKTFCFFAVTELPKGKLIFLNPGQGIIYDIFKAALAVPGCYPEPAMLNGNKYVDGGTINPLPVNECSRITAVKKIVAILSQPLDYDKGPPSLFERVLFWRYFHRHGSTLKMLWEAAECYHENISLLNSMAKENPPKAFIVSPDKMPPASFITRNGIKINKCVDLGYRKVEKIEAELRKFLEC